MLRYCLESREGQLSTSQSSQVNSGPVGSKGAENSKSESAVFFDMLRSIDSMSATPRGPRGMEIEVQFFDSIVVPGTDTLVPAVAFTYTSST